MLQEIVKSHPDLKECQGYLGKALFDLGRFEEAIKPFETAVRLDANDGTALTMLGVVLASRGRVDEAVATLKRAIEIALGIQKPTRTWARHFTKRAILTVRSLSSAKACDCAGRCRRVCEPGLRLEGEG